MVGVKKQTWKLNLYVFEKIILYLLRIYLQIFLYIYLITDKNSTRTR